MFLIYFISYGCNDSALVFLGGAEASASPSFALPMFITIKKIIILHLFLGVPAATVGGTGTPWHTRGYAPALYSSHFTQHVGKNTAAVGFIPLNVSYRLEWMKMKQVKQSGYLKHFQAALLWLQSDYNSTAPQTSNSEKREWGQLCHTWTLPQPNRKEGTRDEVPTALTAC